MSSQTASKLKLALLAPVMATILVAGFAFSAPNQVAHADEPADGYFNILTQDQKMALAVDAESATDGSVIGLEPEDASSENQKFQLTKTDGDLYEITSASNSDLALDVDGNGVQVWTKTGQSNQRFAMAEGPDGSVRLLPASNATSALTLDPGSDGNLTMTNLSLFNRTQSQGFFLRAANLPGMEYTEACVGDKLVYSVTQQVNELGVNAFVRYKSMEMTDTLPQGLSYVSAKLYSSGNVDLTSTAGKFTYDSSTRKLTFTFNGSYLQSGMSLKGEKYRMEITTTIAGIPSTGKFENTGYTTINDTTLTSNKVTTPIIAPALKQDKSVYNKSMSWQIKDPNGKLEVHDGDILHYTITVDQTVKGAVQAATELSDTIPDALKLDSSSVKLTSGNTASVSNDDRTITVNTGRLVYGDQIKVEYDCVVNSTEAGTITNTFGKTIPVIQPGFIKYYRDGESDPIYVDKKASYSDIYQINSEATKAATRANCAGLDGWYLDKECTIKYDPAVNGKAAGEKGFNLYAKNKVTLTYAPTTNSYFLQHPEKTYYLDESLKTKMVSQAQILPVQETHYYGDTVKFAFGADLYYEDMGTRKLTSSQGAYRYANGSGNLLTQAKLTANAIAYLYWSGSSYDGIYAGQ